MKIADLSDSETLYIMHIEPLQHAAFLKNESESVPIDRQADLSAFIKAFLQKPAMKQRFQKLLESEPALLQGHHYWRTTSENGIDFASSLEVPHSILAFSRIYNGKELLCAINLHHEDRCAVYVTVDNALHASGSRMFCLYASDSNSPAELNVEDRNGKAIRITVSPGELVIYS
ncbi:hypothetical protein [Dyadobacter sandarakinus]|uniref:Maltogenic Amylase, C-terminal domain n=1 Tax=Dyadobacter sandarakinus TaxID=2747268 RepID=A0ABX7IBS3_9BACT|nr:hypothetical protein [Dyadobacter sandarakinus]QRR03265.1 hypothetical protein HWI92_21280 [Dyadobacter sandarakinus]